MLIERLISVCVLCLMGIRTADAVRCIPTSLRVKAEFFELSITKASKHHKLIESSSNFVREYEKLAASAGYSVGFEGFGVSLQAAYEGVKDKSESKSKLRHEEKSKEKDYNPLFLQIKRVITTDVNIDGSSARIIEEDFVDTVSISKPETSDELKKRGEEYIRYNFGRWADKEGATIYQNVYEANNCVKQDPVEKFIGNWRRNDGEEFVLEKTSNNKAKDQGGHTYIINGSTITLDFFIRPTGTLQPDGSIRWTLDGQHIFTWKRI